MFWGVFDLNVNYQYNYELYNSKVEYGFMNSGESRKTKEDINCEG